MSLAEPQDDQFCEYPGCNARPLRECGECKAHVCLKHSHRNPYAKTLCLDCLAAEKEKE